MTGAQAAFLFILGAAVESGVRIAVEWWMGRAGARGSKRRKVRQDDYYRHCDGCTVK